MQLDADLVQAARQIVEYVASRGIEAVVVQGIMELPALLRGNGLAQGTALVFAHHSAPGWEAAYNSFEHCTSSFVTCHGEQRFKELLKIVGYPFYNHYMTKRKSRQYADVYAACDRVVLLSSGFADGFLSFGHIENAGKLAFIANALSCEEFLAQSQLQNKEHLVLVVSRFEEFQKRISYALEAWEMIKKHRESDGWTLRIVGHGADEARYCAMVAQQNIPDVEFAGTHDAVAHGDYRCASLFFMTSKSERRGITLMEAQQFGCVPIAFDSYAAVHDIISDGIDGCLVPYPGIERYAHVALSLMADEPLRRTMALNAVEKAKSFSSERVGAQWNELLCGLREECYGC